MLWNSWTGMNGSDRQLVVGVVLGSLTLVVGFDVEIVGSGGKIEKLGPTYYRYSCQGAFLLLY